MNIPGTFFYRIPLLLSTNTFKKGDRIASYYSIKLEILSNSPKRIHNNFLYDTQDILEGDDLELALKHYELLKRNNILWTIF